MTNKRRRAKKRVVIEQPPALVYPEEVWDESIPLADRRELKARVFKVYSEMLAEFKGVHYGTG